MTKEVLEAYESAKKVYAKLGVDTDKALEELSKIKISLHCWQGDDVRGFLSDDDLSGGIQATGNYPGRATTPAELRADLEKAMDVFCTCIKLAALEKLLEI